MWEKEKLFVMSNFSFSHSVFKRCVLQTHENQGLFGNRLMVVYICRYDLFLVDDDDDEEGMCDESTTSSETSALL